MQVIISHRCGNILQSKTGQICRRAKPDASEKLCLILSRCMWQLWGRAWAWRWLLCEPRMNRWSGCHELRNKFLLTHTKGDNHKISQLKFRWAQKYDVCLQILMKLSELSCPSSRPWLSQITCSCSWSDDCKTKTESWKLKLVCT